MADHVASKQDVSYLVIERLGDRWVGVDFPLPGPQAPLRTHTRGDNKAAPRKPAERM